MKSLETNGNSGKKVFYEALCDFKFYSRRSFSECIILSIIRNSLGIVSYWYFIVDGLGIGVECLWGRKKAFVCIDIDNKKGTHKFRNVAKNIFLKVKTYAIKEHFVQILNFFYDVANYWTSDKLFKSHGRWMLEFAKDGYINDMRDTRLIVSLKLGL